MKITLRNIYIYIILLVAVILPINIKAELVNYNEGIIKANNYILNNNYANRSRYLVLPYNGLEENPSFTNGGMISKMEYEISVRDGKSYLSPGIEYWTSTGNESDVSKRYYIDTTIREKNSIDTSGVRVTENVKNGIMIEGQGTYNDPYSFVETFLIRIKSNNIRYGKVYDIGEKEENVIGERVEILATLEDNDYVVDFNMKPTFGYKYENNSGCGNLIKVGSGNQYRINHIGQDINCIVNFNPKIIKFKLVDGIDGLSTEANLKEIYLRYSDKWYSEKSTVTNIESITPPSKIGYEFLGYYYKDDTLAIKPTGEIVLNSDNLEEDIEEQELVGKWKALTYTVTYDGTEKTSGSMSPSTHYFGIKSKLSAVGYKKTGYKFLGWSKTKGGSVDYPDQIEVLDLPEEGTEITLYAVWGKCSVGTYNDGSTNTCIQCPAGYACSGGASKDKCGANTYAQAGSGVCTSCDPGYRSDAGSGSCTKTKLTIKFNVAGGTVKASTQTTDGKTTYTWTQDSSGLVSRSTNGGTATQNLYTYNYGGTVNLANYNNGTYLYISKLGYGAVSNQQWKCTSGCATANKIFDQAVDYKVEDFCDITHKDCTVVVSVNWASCAAGTYGVSGNANCQACPANNYCTGGTNKKACATGYTVAAGKGTAATSCIMSVPAGKRVTTAGGGAVNCAAGTYANTARTINQTQTVGCTNCGANTYAVAGSSSCTACATGYTVAAGKGIAATSCIMSVPAGKRVTTAGGGAVNCAAGTYANTARTINQTQTIGCTGCTAPWTSNAGATSCPILAVNSSTVACNTTNMTGKAIIYTGNCQFINDGNGNWRIKLTSNGTLKTAANIAIDAFLVGGGGGGATGGSNTYGAGGGGGYTTTIKNITAVANTNYEITIGGGGAGSQAEGQYGGGGGTTTAFGYSASGGGGGLSSLPSRGGSGGSGGCGGYLDGTYEAASDGANGGGSHAGSGQGTTTREFGESWGELYSYGGGTIYATIHTEYGSGGRLGIAMYGNYSQNGVQGIVVIRNKR